MEQTGYCCGQIPPKRRKKSEDDILPENPGVAAGAEVIYLGAGDLKIKGSSGLIYYVSDHRRRFKADAADLSGILKMPDFILKP